MGVGKHISTILFCILLILPASFADLEEDIAQLDAKIREFVDTDDANNIIVMGDHASITERTALQVMSKQYANIRAMQRISEKEYKLIEKKGKTFIFVGGPTHNKAAAVKLADESYTQSEESFEFGKALFLESEQGKVIVFSDFTGFNNIPQTAAAKSPLAQFMPIAIVPAAATIIGLLMVWFSPFFMKFLLKILTFVTSAKMMSNVTKRDFKEKYIGFKIAGMRFKLREWLSILGAATVFAVALGYLYLSPNTNLIAFFILTIVGNFIVYGIRHATRLYLDKHHKIHTEYVIWIWGALITALTAWLGNVFALAGYLVKSSDTDDVKYQARIAFIVNAVTFVVFIILYIVNFKNPNILFQMVMLLALAITYLQMLPFKPFDGEKIYKWKKWLWWVSFSILTLIYIPINLLI